MTEIVTGRSCHSENEHSSIRIINHSKSDKVTPTSNKKEGSSNEPPHHVLSIVHYLVSVALNQRPLPTTGRSASAMRTSAKKAKSVIDNVAVVTKSAHYTPPVSNVAVKSNRCHVNIVC